MTADQWVIARKCHKPQLPVARQKAEKAGSIPATHVDLGTGVEVRILVRRPSQPGFPLQASLALKLPATVV